MSLWNALRSSSFCSAIYSPLFNVEWIVPCCISPAYLTLRTSSCLFNLKNPGEVDTSLFYRWGYWGSGKLDNLPNVIQLLSDKAKIWRLRPEVLSYNLSLWPENTRKHIHLNTWTVSSCVEHFISCTLFNGFLFSSCSCYWDFVKKTTKKTKLHSLHTAFSLRKRLLNSMQYSS